PHYGQTANVCGGIKKAPRRITHHRGAHAANEYSARDYCARIGKARRGDCSASQFNFEVSPGTRKSYADFAALFRSAHRFFIISEIRFFASGLMRRLRRRPLKVASAALEAVEFLFDSFCKA